MDQIPWCAEEAEHESQITEGKSKKTTKKSEERDYTWNVQSKEIKHHARAPMSIAIKKGDAVSACHIIEK
jgi:hypothetical protein